MLPQLPKNIFIVTEPLYYTINASEPTIINLPISNVTIDETYFVSPIWNIQFSGILASYATSEAEITYVFNLFKINDIVPITTFNYVQSLNQANTPQNSSVVLKYELNGNLSENQSDYILELASISSDSTSTIDIIISSGTIIGYAIPQV